MLGGTGFQDHLVNLVIDVKGQEGIENALGAWLKYIITAGGFTDVSGPPHALIGPFLRKS